ncbi:MAG: elongation factor Tu [Deltaproteobacteria bacterium]|nr:elongation factor Tu [Deltaproteobacteria bacterium]
MTEDKSRQDKPQVRVAVLGQTDHGKSTLTAAIMKVQSARKLAKPVSFDDIDRGASVRDETNTVIVSATQVEYESGRRRYTLVDCPSHLDCVKNLITGAAPVDCGILVVSAADGVMPETRDHVVLAQQAGLSDLVIFINKCDAVDEPEMIDLMEIEARELLNTYGFVGDNAGVVHGAAQRTLDGDPEWQASIDELIDALDNNIIEPVTDVDMPFLMAVDDVYYDESRRSYAAGRIARGTIKRGMLVEIIGLTPTKTSVVTGVEMSRKPVDAGQAGDTVGCGLHGVDKEDLVRGRLLAKPDSIATHTRFDGEVYVLTQGEGGGNEPLSAGKAPEFIIRTATMATTIQLPVGVEEVVPGDYCTVTFELGTPVALEAQSRFVLRQGERTVAAGVVTKISD